jgi:hypothetical protein
VDNPALANFTRTAGTNPHDVTLSANQNYLDADFGYAGKGDIRGLVYYDWNQDGTRSQGEATIPNVFVCLYADADKNGVKDSNTPIACVNTDSQGFFVFGGQLPGGYIVEETDPSGTFSTTPNTIDTVLILSQGQGVSAGNDFGDLLTVSLGDFVWVDNNANGIQDPSETTGLNGVPLHIVGTNVAGQAVNVTMTTTNGNYLDANLIPGTYIVSAPDNFNGYVRSSPATRSTTLTTTKIQDLTLDFGYAYPTGIMVTGPTATTAEHQVTLLWTVAGSAPEGWNVWRANNAKGTDAMLLTAAPLKSDSGQYTYVDDTAKTGLTYWYWLEYAGDATRYGPVSITVGEQAPQWRVLLPFMMKSK